MNINSHQFEWIPFGLRGTVVGRADNSLIVLFDEQFLGSGRDILAQFPYRGARVYPQNVINLTRCFTQDVAKEGYQYLQKFSEKPIEG